MVIVTNQVVVSGITTLTNTGFNRFTALFGGENTSWDTSIAFPLTLCPANGHIKNFKIELSVAPGSGKSYQFTVMRVEDNLTFVNTASAIDITISDTATVGSSTSTVPMSASSFWAIKCVPSGTPTTTLFRWSFIWQPDVADETILMGGTGANLTTDVFLPLSGSGNTSTIEFDVEILIPTNGTIKNLHCSSSVVPTGLTKYIYMVRKNGSDTALTCEITNSDNRKCSDTTHEISVTAGDRICLAWSKFSNPTTTKHQYGVVFVPDISGRFIIPMTSSDTTVTRIGTAEYVGVTTTGATFSGTEANHQQLSDAFELKTMYVETDTEVEPEIDSEFNVGYMWRLRRDGINITGASVSITGFGGTTGSNNFSGVNITDGWRLTTRYNSITSGKPAVEPVSVKFHVSYSGFITPFEFSKDEDIIRGMAF